MRIIPEASRVPAVISTTIEPGVSLEPFKNEITDWSAVKTPEEILNMTTVYRYSGLVDTLRDTALELYKCGQVSPETIQIMSKQYGALRIEISAALNESAAAGVDRWVPVLTEKVTMDGIYFAAAQLSKWADLVHGTSVFLLNEELLNVSAQKALEDAKSIVKNMNNATLLLTQETDSRPGTYL
jgi:hypothetical protein